MFNNLSQLLNIQRYWFAKYWNFHAERSVRLTLGKRFEICEAQHEFWGLWFLTFSFLEMYFLTQTLTHTQNQHTDYALYKLLFIGILNHKLRFNIRTYPSVNIVNFIDVGYD